MNIKNRLERIEAEVGHLRVGSYSRDALQEGRLKSMRGLALIRHRTFTWIEVDQHLVAQFKKLKTRFPHRRDYFQTAIEQLTTLPPPGKAVKYAQ